MIYKDLNDRVEVKLPGYNKMVAPGFTIINNIGFEPGEVVIEIGSETGRGSTEYLAAFCKAKHINLYSVDTDKTQYDGVIYLSDLYFTAFCITGEDFLTKIFPNFNKPVKFVYLDNFDWIYEGTENIRRVRACVAKYKERGVDLNNTDSQKAHLQQSALVSNYVVKNGVILFDDTWQPSEGAFNGKGGTAIPWLLNHGFVIYKTYNTPDLEWNFVSVIKKV